MRAAAAVLAASALLLVVPPAEAARPRVDHARTLFRFQDSRITESSGLVDLGHGLMATINDSGDGPYVYVVDQRGRTVGFTDYGGDAVDVESMAPIDAGHVWVGDTGGNNTPRSSVQVYRVPVGRGQRTVHVRGYELAYPDGDHDAETLLADPRTGRLYVVTKALFGGVVYAAPRHLAAGRANRLRPLVKVPGFLTDGTFLPDGREVLLRGYADAAIYTFPGFAPVGPSFALPRQRQGEGVSVGPHGRVRLSSEGEHAPVLQIQLPPAVRRALAAPASASPAPAGSPTAGSSAVPQPYHPPPRPPTPDPPRWWAGASLAAVMLLGGAWVWVHRRRP